MLLNTLDQIEVARVPGSLGLGWVVDMSHFLIDLLVDVNRKPGLRQLGSSLTASRCRKPNVNRTLYFLGLRWCQVDGGVGESAVFIV